jgi:hypothetical protein
VGVLRVAPAVYRVGAISNWVVSIPAFVAFDAYVGALMPAKPNFPFLIWIWSGMAVLWGVMFWEISGDVVGRRRLIKYSYLEKSVTSISVLVAVATGNLVPANAVGIFFTDIIWIPAFVLIHLAVRRQELPAAA